MVLLSKISTFKTSHSDHELLSFYHHYDWIGYLHPLVQHLILLASSSSMDPIGHLSTAIPSRAHTYSECLPLSIPPLLFAILWSLVSAQIGEDRKKSHVNAPTRSTLVLMPCNLRWILTDTWQSYNFLSYSVTHPPQLFTAQCFHYPIFHYSLPYCNLVYHHSY